MKKDQFEEIISQFMASPEVTYSFDSFLNSHDRMIVHEIAEKLGLFHESQGEGKNRWPKLSWNDDLVCHSQLFLSGVLFWKSEILVMLRMLLSKTCQPRKLPNPRRLSHVARVPNQFPKTTLNFTNLGMLVFAVTYISTVLNFLNLVGAKSLKNQTQWSCQRRARNQRKSNLKSWKEMMRISILFWTALRSSTKFATMSSAKRRRPSWEPLVHFATFAFVWATACQRYSTTRIHLCPHLHMLLQIHGCGDLARRAARMQISRDGKIFSGSGRPDMKPDAAKRKQLQVKLDKKLNTLSEGRKAKTNEKKWCKSKVWAKMQYIFQHSGIADWQTSKCFSTGKVALISVIIIVVIIMITNSMVQSHNTGWLKTISFPTIRGIYSALGRRKWQHSFEDRHHRI